MRSDDYESVQVEGQLEMAAEFIPARRRRLIYVVLSLLGYLFGATAVGFTAAGSGVPSAVVVALAVLGFLIGPAGQLAAVNTR